MVDILCLYRPVIWIHLLTAKFFQQIFRIIHGIFAISESGLILTVLSPTELVGGFLIMVIFSGYEYFILKMTVDDKHQKLNWMGKMDVNSIKKIDKK